MKFRKIAEDGNLFLYEIGEGGNGASVIVNLDTYSEVAYQGYGAVHHVAFRVSDEAVLASWLQRLIEYRIPNSGIVNRFWFKSLYSRIYPSILFEFATDGPGFVDDEEKYATLGETLSIPPRFRNMRDQIEKLVRPIDTIRSNKKIEKEYL
jgi:glyoxalase family protein